jgi:hypothetical protein
MAQGRGSETLDIGFPRGRTSGLRIAYLPMDQNVKVIKSVLPSPGGMGALWMPYGSTVEGAIGWPRDPYALLSLYAASAEHGRAIHVRAAAAFGNGVTGDAADAFEEFCPTGSADLFMGLGVDYATFGNAFLYDGPLGLERRPALTMSRHTGGGYIQSLYDPHGNHSTVFYRDPEIVHIKAPCPAGHYYSLPDWSGGWGMLELVKAATDYNREFFRNHALPQYAIVTYGSKLTPAEETAVQNFFSSNYKGPGNQHKTLYLHCDDPQHGKVEFQKLTDTKDGDFLKLLDAARDRIVIAHGVPPRMMGIVSAGNLGGGGEVTGQLQVFEEISNKPTRTRFLGALRPWLKRRGIDWRGLQFAGMNLAVPATDTGGQPPTPAQKSADPADGVARLVALLERF